MRRACDRYLPLFHGLKHRGLNLRRGTVDFVTQHDIGKNRARLETKLAIAIFLVVHLSPGHVRRQQIRRELDTAEVGLEIIRQRFDRARLRESR